MSQVVRGGFPDRQFDVDFWQQQGDAAIFDAAWEMFELGESFKGTHAELRSDFKDFLRLLNQRRVKHLIVDGYVVMKYTEPFYTEDMDIWIEGTPEHDAYQHLTQEQPVFQFGMAPARVDVMTTIDGVSFSDAWIQRVETHLDDIKSLSTPREVRKEFKLAIRDE